MKVAVDNIIVAKGIGAQNQSYEIAFDAGDGMMMQTYELTDKNGKIPAFPMTIKSGYTLEGWYLPDGSKASLETVFSHDTKLTAKWVSNPSAASASSEQLWLSALRMHYGRSYTITAEAGEGA